MYFHVCLLKYARYRFRCATAPSSAESTKLKIVQYHKTSSLYFTTYSLDLKVCTYSLFWRSPYNGVLQFLLQSIKLKIVQYHKTSSFYLNTYSLDLKVCTYSIFWRSPYMEFYNSFSFTISHNFHKIFLLTSFYFSFMHVLANIWIGYVCCAAYRYLYAGSILRFALVSRTGVMLLLMNLYIGVKVNSV